MLVAHAPVGWLTGSTLRGRSARVACVVGALLPDVDVVPSLVLHVHHHDWPTHWPVTWLLLGLGVAPLLAGRARPVARLVLLALANAELHLALDTLAGDVRWLAPWSFQPFALVHVQRTFEPWWVNFLLHPTFLAELALVALATHRWRRAATCERPSPDDSRCHRRTP
ncbi:MAG: metal-dependent hydrolase [Myxococcota bacterium]